MIRPCSDGRPRTGARLALVALGCAAMLRTDAFAASPLAPPAQLASDGDRASGIVTAPPDSPIALGFAAVTSCAHAHQDTARSARGEARVVTDGSGLAAFTARLSPPIAIGEGLVVTATDTARGASASGPCITIGGRAPVTLDPPGVALRAGGTIALTGTNITPGTVLKVFVGTAAGGFDAYPAGLVPSSTTDGTWTGTLSFPWPVAPPDSISLGQGYAGLELVRTDQGYDESNAVGAVLFGNDALLPKVPTVQDLDGFALSVTSSDPSIHVANVESVLAPGTTLTIHGSGFANPLVNLFTSIGNLGPLTPASFTAISIDVQVPADAKIGPGSVQVVNQPSFRISNAVSIPIGEAVTVSSVAVNGNAIEVTGTGFNDDLTVVNFFAVQNGTLKNLGGLTPNGSPRILLDVTSSTQLSFQRPPFVAAGPAYVEAINPPYIPFTSSGSGPGGAVSLP